MKLKKVNKNILIGSLSIIGLGAILGTTGIAISNHEKSGIDNSLISKDNTTDTDFSTKVFLGTTLTKEEVKKIGWDQKISISLEDWAKYAPNVTQLGDFDKFDAPFYENNKLETIQIPSKIQSINNFAFSNSSTLKNVFFEDNSQLLNIGDFAFNNSSIESINIPNSIHSIGKDVFGNNSSLPGNVISLLSNFNESQNIEPRVITGDTLTKEGVATLGWDTKTQITLNDWATQAPNVTKISESATGGQGLNAAFSQNTTIQSIQIPAKVTEINFGSFFQTTALTSISFESRSQLNIIEAAAFRQSAITSIQLSSTLTSIGNFAFDGSGLTSIEIPAEVTNIKQGTFDNTSALQIVNFASGSKLTTIERIAFRNSGIESIKLPNLVSSIANDSFLRTLSLVSIEMPYFLEGDSSPKYGFTQTQWESITWKTVPFLGDTLTKTVVTSLGWNTKTSITLTDWQTQAPNVTKISETATGGQGLNAAFSENMTIQSIQIPAKVTNINFGSFFQTTALTSISFEANSKLNIIENAAFRQSAITSITLPNTLTSIGNYAFDGSGLTSIAIPNKITHIRANAFANTTALQTVTFEANTTLSIIENNAFQSSGISSITLPNTLTSIGARAFEDSGLVTIAIPNGVNLIRQQTFANTSSLKTVTFDTDNSTVFRLEANTFTGSSIESINLPDSIVSLTTAFVGTTLTDIEIPASMRGVPPTAPKFGFTQDQWNVIKWRSGRFLGEVLSRNAVLGLGWETKETITKQDWLEKAPNVTTISGSATGGDGSNGAFANSTVLKSIFIPAGVTNINFSSFFNTSVLTSVTFEANSQLSIIQNTAFRQSAITSIQLPNTVTSIGVRAFNESKLTSINVPDSIQSIGENAFLDTNSLTNIEMPSSMRGAPIATPKYGFTQTQWNNINWRIVPFLGDTLTKSVVISLGWSTKTTISSNDWDTFAPNVTKIGASTFNDGTGLDIGESPFANITSLQSIEIPDRITSINYASFYKTTSLRSVTFLGTPKVDLISRSAFEGSGITSINIPSSVLKIGSFSFANTTSFATITFASNSELTTIDSAAFYNSKLTAITIPASVTNISNDRTFGNTNTTLQGNRVSMSVTFKPTPLGSPKFGFNQAQWESIFWTGTINLNDTMTSSFVVEFQEGGNIVQNPPINWKATSAMSAGATEVRLGLQYAIGTTENNLIFDWSDYATLKEAITTYSNSNDILQSQLNIYARMYIPSATGSGSDMIGGVNYVWDKSIKKIYGNTTGTISDLFTVIGGTSATIPAGKFIRTYSRIPSTWADSLSAEGNKSIEVKILNSGAMDINYWTERGVKLEVSPDGGTNWTRINEFNNQVFDASATNKMQFRLSVIDAQYNQIYGSVESSTTPVGIRSIVVEKEIVAKIQLNGVVASDLLSNKLTISGTTHNFSIVEDPALYTVSGLNIATAKTFFEIKYTYDGTTYFNRADFISTLSNLRANALNAIDLSLFKVKYEFTELGLSKYYSSEISNDPDASSGAIKTLDTSSITKTIDVTSQINDVPGLRITGSTEMIIWGNMASIPDSSPFYKIEYGTYVRQANGSFTYVWSETRPTSIFSKTVPEGEDKFPIAIRFMPKQTSDRVEIGSILGEKGIFEASNMVKGYQVNTDGLVSIINIDTTDLINRLVFTGYANNLNNGATSSVMESQAFQLVDPIFRNQVELKYQLSVLPGQWLSLDQLKAAMSSYLINYSNETSGIMIFSNGTIPGVTIEAQFLAKDPSKFTVVAKPEPIVELNTSGIKTKIDLKAYVEILKTQKVIPSGTSATNIGKLTFPGMSAGNIQFGGRTYEQIESIISSSIDIEFKAPGFHNNNWVSLDQITSLNFDNELFIRFNVKTAAKPNIELSLVTDNDYETHLANGFKLLIDLPIEIQVNPNDLISEITLGGNTKALSVNDDQVYANLIAKNPGYAGKVKILYTIGKTPIALDTTKPSKTEFTKAELVSLLSLRNIDILLANMQITGRYALADGISPEDYKIKDETPVNLNITNVLLFINRSNYYETASKVTVSGTSSGIIWGSEIDTLFSSLSEGLILQYSIDNTVSVSDPSDDNRWTTTRPTTISPNLKFLAIRLVVKTGYVFEEAPKVFIIDTSKILLIIEVQTSWLDSIGIAGNTRNLEIDLTTLQQMFEDRNIPGKEFIEIQFFFGGTPPSDLGFPTNKEWFSAAEIKTIFSRLRGAKNERELILFRNTIKARYTLSDEGYKTYRLNINGQYVDEQYPDQANYFRNLVTSTVNVGFRGYINLDLINKFTPDSFQVVGSDKEPELKTDDSIAAMLDFYKNQTTAPFDIYYTKIENDFSNTNYKLFGENGFLTPFHPGFIIDLDDAGKAMPIWFKMVARPSYDIWENGTLLPDGKIIKITNFDIQPRIANPLTSPPDIRFTAADGTKFYQGSGSFSVFVSGTNTIVDSTYLNAAYPNVRPYVLKLEYNFNDILYTPAELEAVKLDPSKWTDEAPTDLRVGQYVMTRVAINNPIFEMTGGDTMTPQTRVSGLLVHADQLKISPDLILTNSDIYGYSALDGQAKVEVAKLISDFSGNYLGADLQMSVETEFHKDASGRILLDSIGNPLVLRNPEGATIAGNYKDANGNDILDANGRTIPILTIPRGDSIILAPPLRTGIWKPAMKMNDWSVEGSFSQSDNTNNLEWRLFEGQHVRFSLIPRVGDGTPIRPDFFFDETAAPNLDIELTNIKYIIETNGINYRFDQNQLKEITFASDDGGDVAYTGSSHISSLLTAVQILSDGTEKTLTGIEIENQVRLDFDDKVQIRMQLIKKNGTTQIAAGTNISQFNELQNGDVITVSFESKDINFLLPRPITPLTIIVKDLFVRPLDSELFRYLRPNFTGSLNGSGSFNIRVTAPNSPKDDNETIFGFDQWYEYQVWNPDKTLKTEWTKDESKINNLVNGDKVEWKLVNSEGVLANDYYNTLLANDSTDDNIKFRVVNVEDKIEQTFQNGIGSSQNINPDNLDGTPNYPEDSGWIVSGLKIEITLNPNQQEQFELALKEFKPTFSGVNKFGSMSSNISNDMSISKEVVIVWYARGEDGIERKITNFQDAKLSNGDQVWATIAPSQFAIENGLIIDDSVSSTMLSEIFTVSGLEVIVNSPTQTLIISLITASSVLLVGITAALVFVKKNSKLKDNKIFKK